MRRQTAVYRCFDTSGILLYIGRTKRLRQRFKEHRKTQPWWPEVTRIDLAFYDGDKEADREERRAILVENPFHNDVRFPFTPPLPKFRVWEPLPPELASQIKAASRKRSQAKTRPGRDGELAALVYEALMIGCQPGIVASATRTDYGMIRRLTARHLALHPELEPIPPRRSRTLIAA